MSYSFSVKAATKVEAAEQAKAKMAEVVASQPIHSRDQDQAADAADKVMGVIADPTEGQAVNLYISGSLGWRGDQDNPEAITSASLSVSASITDKE